MTKTQAIKILAKLLGPRFAYRENPTALLADARPAVATLQAAHLAAERAERALQDRVVELKLADAKYQELLAARTRALAEHRTLLNASSARRITVGRDGSMFFSVTATGDNWAEVVAKAEADLKR